MFNMFSNVFRSFSGKIAPRMPYKLYKGSNNILIRVGRTAKDNDLLSIDKQYRNDLFWWLHVDEAPGSHVVICYPYNDIMIAEKETVIDAALLAGINSTISSRNCYNVHLTRCSNITKKDNDPPGLVRISGAAHSISVYRNKHFEREKRLLSAVLPVNFDDRSCMVVK